MKLINIILLLVLVSFAVGQVPAGNPVEIRNVDVAPVGDQVKIEVTLTQPVVPTVIVATNPDRLVLELPNTSSSAKQQRAVVNQGGVKMVRIGLNSANPPVTRVVLDLVEPRLYELATDGKKVTLTLLASETARQRRGGPVPAATGTLLGKLHREGPENLPTTATAPAPVTPPASLPPVKTPVAQSNPAAGTMTASTSRPSAANPNFGSLQPGTVSPNTGAPGQGVVPGRTSSSASTGLGLTKPESGFPEVAVVRGDRITPVDQKQSSTPGPQSKGAQPATTPAPASTDAKTVNAATSAAARPAVPAVPPQPVKSAANNPTPVIAGNMSTEQSKTGVLAKQPLQAAPSGSLTANTAIPAPPAAMKPAPGPQSPKPQAAAPSPGVTAASVSTPGAGTKAVASKQVPVWEQPAFPGTATSGTATTAVASRQEPVPAQPARVPTNASASTSGRTTTPVASKQVPLWEQPAFPGASTGVVVSSSATPANPGTGSPAKIGAQPATAVTATASSATTSSAAGRASSSQGAQAAATLQPSTSNTATVAAPTTGAPASVSSGGITATPTAASKASASPQASKPTLVASAAPAPAPAKPDLDTQVPVLLTRPSNTDIRVSYKVKYVAEGVAYLDGGRASGLTEGAKLIVLDKDPFLAQPTAAAVPTKSIVAELQVTAVADASAVADIHTPKRNLKSGDLAFLSSDETEAMVAQRSLSATRKYPSVISFTQSDTLDEEARAEVPRPPLPEVNRARGRFGFDYSGMMSHGATPLTSSNFGFVVRTDITRIYGTYWNLSGFWRGRLTSTNSSQTSLQDLINRTYHLGLTYDNPRSPFVAGFGRLYLPWATSLDTIDGGYVGGRIGRTILGVFAGSTPDPSSYSYNPNQRIAGSFVNFSGGSFDGLRYTSTSGVGLSMLKWDPNRPFVFAENGFYYKRFLGIYHAFQADSPKGNAVVQAPGAGVSRSFLTVRLQPHERIEFDLNHTYFRDLPTFDLSLVGTTLLDKYLFQGYSAGVRVEVIRQVWLYTTLGKSNRSGDPTASLNQLYGVTFGRVPWTGVRADLHYSKFNGSFGRGFYEAISLSRNIRDSFHGELLAGRQSFVSTLAASNTSKFVTANLDTNVGRHYFFMGGFTWNRGGALNYDQWYLSLGYRFDSKFKGQ